MNLGCGNHPKMENIKGEKPKGAKIKIPQELTAN